MIGEEYTHAVKKTAKEGDFRVQDDHGGKVERYQPNKMKMNFKKLFKCDSFFTYVLKS